MSRRTRWRTRAAAAVVGLYVLLAALGPLLVPATALSVVDAQAPPFAAPSPAHPMGTDSNGLSVLALVVAGARVSISVGLLATAAAIGLGVVAGLGAGILPRGPAAVLTWLVDWFLTLPQLPLAIVLVAVLRPGLAALVLAIALTSWAPVARVIRAAVLVARSQPHLDRVRSLGAGAWYVARAHVLVQVLPVIAVNTALTLANAVLAEAAFSYLGLGDPDQVSWGSMLHQANLTGALSAGAWWLVLAPGLAVITVALAAGTCAAAVGVPEEASRDAEFSSR